MRLRDEDYIVAGDKIYTRCPICDKLVKQTGFLAGWHLCLRPEDRERVARERGLKLERE